VPAVEDKIVQMSLKKILEAIFEVDFLDVSYGFRPNRNCHQALDDLDKAVMTKPVNYIVDMDIEKFFDTVDHKKLMELLRERIADPSILRLIGRFLKAGVMEEGKYYQVDRGTPQGGILSPILSNIYLHYCLDLWFEKVVKKQMRGFCQLIRYADDFVVGFQKAREARAFERSLRERLGKFGLKVSEEKSRIISFGRYPYLSAQKEGKRVATFDFLEKMSTRQRLVCLQVLVTLLVVYFLSVSLVYAQANQKLDINKATVSELVTVKGIGEVKAKAIVDFIKKKNGIKSMDELLEVKGIGPRALEKLKQRFEVKPKR